MYVKLTAGWKTLVALMAAGPDCLNPNTKSIQWWMFKDTLDDSNAYLVVRKTDKFIGVNKFLKWKILKYWKAIHYFEQIICCNMQKVALKKKVCRITYFTALNVSSNKDGWMLFKPACEWGWTIVGHSLPKRVGVHYPLSPCSDADPCRNLAMNCTRMKQLPFYRENLCKYGHTISNYGHTISK